MGQITTGVGLVSGLDIASIVDQLVAIQARPRQQVEQRNVVLQSQQVAFQDVNARVLAAQSAVNRFSTETVFQGTTATSSDESVLTATSTTGAVPGNYTFRVAQLVSAQQNISRGFADRNDTALAPAGATLTFDRAEARLDSTTAVGRLNGGDGINRGFIRITDRSGNTSLVDLSAVVNVDDVVDTINRTTGVNVVAAIDGDRLTVTDATGSTSQDLVIANVGTTGTATSLGLAGNATTDGDGDDIVLTGTNINTLGENTLLGDLNDGNGVRASAGTDFTLTTGAGSFAIDLSSATTLGEVFEIIETASGGDITASNNGAAIELTSASGSIAIAPTIGNLAADDLGLNPGSIAGGTLTGERVFADLNSKLVKFLQGGSGINGVIGTGSTPLTSATNLADLFNGSGLPGDGSVLFSDIGITDRNGTNNVFNLEDYTTVGDFLSDINTDFGGSITASINSADNTITITDNTGGGGNLIIEDRFGSTAAAALGIAINDAVNAVTSVDTNPLLVSSSSAQINVTDSTGASATVDLAGARSISDILDAFNNAGLGVTASLNNAGTGLQLTDTAGGAGDLIVADSSGTAAIQLGLTGTFTNGKAEGSALNFQYITEASRLDALGIQPGQFRIFDSDGDSGLIDLTQGNEVTIQDVIDEINSRGIDVNARINDAGNGLVLEDTGSGATAIQVQEEGSTTAADLGILGAATAAGADLDGSFRKTITVGTGDTLDDVVNLINDADLNVTASIINDGSPSAPFRLSLASTDAGTDGAFTFDDGGIGFNSTVLNEAQDAAVFFGGADPASALLITSTSNSLDSVIPGADIDLLTVSDQPVQVTISRDDEGIVSAVSDFVSAFNDLNDTIVQYDSFDAETETRGLLLGDPTLAQIQSRLFNSVIGANNELTGQFTALSQLGIRVGSGARLQFDESEFRQALTTDRDAVQALFTFEQFAIDPDTGEEDTSTVTARSVGVELRDLFEDFLDSENGLITTATDNIQAQINLNNDRIEDLNDRLDASRARLEAQFIAMESALAQLQGQGQALGSLTTIAASTRSAGAAASSG